MSDIRNELGKMLFRAVEVQRIHTIKEIITESNRDPKVVDWKNEMVICVFGVFISIFQYFCLVVKFAQFCLSYILFLIEIFLGFR